MNRTSNQLLFLAALIASANAIGQPIQAEQDAMLYLESVAMPKKAVACSARMLGYSAKFEEAFARWSSASKQRLAAGEAFLRADAEKNKIPFQINVEAVAITAAQSLESTSQALLEENCNAMLQQLAVPVRSGT